MSMDFKDLIKQFSGRALNLMPQLQTEEATKNALIMPFLQLLGYDVFNPFEVVPEFVADIGIKKGEKVDYVILKDNLPIMLIECKHYKEKLDPHNSQLFRYFHVSKAKFAILTNGINYRFYTDLIETNKMDEKPFFEFNIIDIKEVETEELKKFHKSYFNIEEIVTTASELKYTGEIKTILHNEFKAPSANFVRYFAKQIYGGAITEKVLATFTELTKRSLTQFVNDTISDRLKFALDQQNTTVTITTNESTPNNSQENGETNDNKDSRIVTTEEEMEGFFIVKSILRKSVVANRIFPRDTISYFGILLDDNNRKPLCRLWFNGSKKYLGIFDANKKETKILLNSLDDIFEYAEELNKTIELYEATMSVS